MPLPGSIKSFLTAARYPFAKRLGLIPPANIEQVFHDFDNNSYTSWSNAAGTGSIEGMRVDTNDRLRINGSGFSGTPFTVTFNMNANASLADQTFFIADQPYEVLAAYESHATAGNDAGAVTATIMKETSTQAPVGGVSVLASTFNLKGTANTMQTVAGSSTLANRQLATGDRLSVDFVGTLTTLAGVQITVVLAPGFAGDHAVYNMAANGSLADQAFYVATRNQKITRIDYIHSTAGTNGSAVNLQVEKCTGTTAPGSGTDLLTNNSNAGFDCKGTINTVQNGALSATAANLRLAPGDRLAVDFAGTLTALAGVVVVVTFEPYYESFDISWSMLANGSLADCCIFQANRPYRVLYCSEVHSTAGNDASAVNLQLTIDRGTDAPGAGTDLISLNANAGFNLKGTANTVQVGTFVAEGNNYLLPGDRLSLDFAGTLTTLAGVVVTVTLVPA